MDQQSALLDNLTTLTTMSSLLASIFFGSDFVV